MSIIRTRQQVKKKSKGNSKVALSTEQFEALSKSMESHEPIKVLMTKTLNLMIEAEFEIKIGAQKCEHASERKRSPDGTKFELLRISNLKYPAMP